MVSTNDLKFHIFYLEYIRILWSEVKKYENIFLLLLVLIKFFGLFSTQISMHQRSSTSYDITIPQHNLFPNNVMVNGASRLNASRRNFNTSFNILDSTGPDLLGYRGIEMINTRVEMEFVRQIPTSRKIMIMGELQGTNSSYRLRAFQIRGPMVIQFCVPTTYSFYPFFSELARDPNCEARTANIIRERVLGDIIKHEDMHDRIRRPLANARNETQTQPYLSMFNYHSYITGNFLVFQTNQVSYMGIVDPSVEDWIRRLHPIRSQIMSTDRNHQYQSSNAMLHDGLTEWVTFTPNILLLQNLSGRNSSHPRTETVVDQGIIPLMHGFKPFEDDYVPLEREIHPFCIMFTSTDSVLRGSIAYRGLVIFQERTVGSSRADYRIELKACIYYKVVLIPLR